MSGAEIWTLLWGFAQGFIVSVIMLLAVFVGFCVVLGLPKLRSSRGTRIVRSLDEVVGTAEQARYLPPDAPRGPADQLRSPELLEASKRHSS